MNFFKSIWMRLRKSNQLPGNTVLVPISDFPKGTTVTIDLPQKPKRKYTRKKPNVTH
jgi:hypothetical protein